MLGATGELAKRILRCDCSVCVSVRSTSESASDRMRIVSSGRMS